MPFDPQILDLLVCPETRTKLSPADANLVASVNVKIAAGEVQTHGGQPVSEPVTDALVREDGKCLYRVDDDIPNLLIDARIDL